MISVNFKWWCWFVCFLNKICLFQGVSFNIDGVKRFVSLVQKSRVHNPGVEYDSPSAFQISNRLLDELYVEKNNEIQSIIAKSPIWNVHFFLTANKTKSNWGKNDSNDFKNIRHELFDQNLQSEIQDGSRVAIEMKTVMDKICAEKIVIVTTDNASDNASARQLWLCF